MKKPMVKNKLLLTISILLALLFIYLLWPITATREYDGQTTPPFTPFSYTVPRWKLVLFEEYNFKLEDVCKKYNESTCEGNILCQKLYADGTICDGVEPNRECKTNNIKEYKFCTSRI